MMTSYFNRDEATDKAMYKGWYHSGDIGYLDVDGYLWVNDRVDDMIISGGENIYPREIEEFLYRHPAVQEVQVIGVPDQKYGEELCAWIVLRPGATLDADGVREFCRDQIAYYKVPRYIRFVDSFPMTITGKVQKFKMREVMKEELKLAEDKTA